MAEKLSWSELRRALAARASISEKEANAFLAALNAQIIEALKNDKQVKINGLGTFKLQAVAPRKSVNVTTGEEITIEGYNKVAFVPEAGVKELVETVNGTQNTEHRAQTDNAAKTAEGDPIQKLGAQAEEIVDLLGDLGQSPKEEESKAEEPKAEEPKAEEQKAEEPVVVAPVVVAPVVEEPKPEEKKEEKPKKKSHFWRDTLICVVILLILLVIGYFFFREQVSGWVDSLVHLVKDKTELKVDEAALTDEENAVLFEDELNAAEQALADEAAVIEPEEVKANDLSEFTYSNLITTESLPVGSRLAWLARKYYGSPIYWPYIFAANEDRIVDPDVIPVGTAIRVPELTKEQLDTTNVQVLQLLEKLRKGN